MYYTHSIVSHSITGLWAKQKMKPATYIMLLEIHKLENYLFLLF